MPISIPISALAPWTLKASTYILSLSSKLAEILAEILMYWLSQWLTNNWELALVEDVAVTWKQRLVSETEKSGFLVLVLHFCHIHLVDVTSRILTFSCMDYQLVTEVFSGVFSLGGFFLCKISAVLKSIVCYYI